ncbi:MAG TPA: hypothetical protein VGK49_01540, partial [Ilumatobacteraceae bacterium]
MRTLSFSVEQDEFAASVAATVERFGAGVAVGGDRVWCELGAIGLLGIGTPDGGGTMIDLVAGMRAAGATGCQGPFLGAVLGTRILPDLAGAIADGTAHVSLVAGGVAAWAADATAFVAIDDAGDAARVEVISSTPFDTLAHEPWARVDVRRPEPLAVTAHDLAAVELSRAAWLVGAA